MNMDNMNIITQLSEDHTSFTITLSGRFDYTRHKDFTGTYGELKCEPEKYILNMEDIESIDSCALGMLLLLKNHAGGDDADIQIVNASPDIVKLMNTCKFDCLFNIIQ